MSDGKGGSLTDGLSQRERITQKQPRNEHKPNQGPVTRKETVKDERGSFPVK